MPRAEASVIALPGRPAPRVAADAFIAPGGVVVGAVTLGDRSSVWYNAVLRADYNDSTIVVGARSNLQDGVAVHVDSHNSTTIGDGVSVGHNAVVHACTIGDDVLIGMGAVILTGAVIGAGSLVAAGTVVLEGTVIPPRSLVAGVPGKVRRQTTEDEVGAIRENADFYVRTAGLHAGAVAVENA